MKLTSASNPRKRDYQVAWISALSREDVIARAMLDETFQTPTDLSGDDNCYTYGRIGSHYVVLATLPKGKVGVEQAGRTATDIVHSFPNVQFGLMVGIAGGVSDDFTILSLFDCCRLSPALHCEIFTNLCRLQARKMISDLVI